MVTCASHVKVEDKKGQKPLSELFSGSRAWTTLAKIPGTAHGSASIQTRATIGLQQNVIRMAFQWRACTCLLGVDQF